MASVPDDMTQLFNTQLSPEEEAAYQQWAIENGRIHDTYDYDMRGAWKANVGQSGNGHYPDTYKKPNHPTFSKESQYSKPGDMEGGEWLNENGKDVFIPGMSNLAFRNLSQLKDYFAHVEPNAELRMPIVVEGKRK